MHPPAFLQELVVVFVVAVLVVLVLTRFRLPTIAGFIVAGALIGPTGLSLTEDTSTIEALAEVGVALLLFTIGLEFSLAHIRRLWRLLALGGGLQVGLTIAAVLGIAVALRQSIAHGLFYGFLVAMSSSAIVLRALAERQETDAPHGRLIVGALVFQDLCVVPLMLLIPMLAGRGGNGLDVAWALGKALALVVGTVVLGRVIVPHFLSLVASARRRELFVLAVLLVVSGVAWLTSLAGLSLALGAFLAGIVLADSEYGHQAMSDILPFRETLTSLFFISVGMLFDFHIVVARPLVLAILVAGVLVGKSLIAALAALVMRFPPRVAVLAGIGLAQIGEFSFVLCNAGRDVGLISTDEQRLFVAMSVLTMLVTPIASRLAPHIAAGASRLRRLTQLLGAPEVDESPLEKPLSAHVIVAGYGVAGRQLGDALRACAIPHFIVDINAETVRAARARGENVYYGDITSGEILDLSGIQRARELVILINDPQAARRTTSVARRAAPDLPIVVRTKYVLDMDDLRKLGATDVIVEEFETAVEIVARVLRAAGVPRNVIGERIEHMRRQGIGIERPVTVARRLLGEVHELRDLKVETFLVRAEHWANDRTLAEFHLIVSGRAHVVAVHRHDRTIHNPRAFETFEVGDVIYLVGDGPQVREALHLLAEGPDGLA
jgi:CPA2 family monovalent cation:H+ antiporter-2